MELDKVDMQRRTTVCMFDSYSKLQIQPTNYDNVYYYTLYNLGGDMDKLY